MLMASIQTLRTDAEASVLGEGPLIGRGGEGVLQTVTVDGDLEWFVHAADRLPGCPSHGRGGDRGEAAELRAAVSGEDMEREEERDVSPVIGLHGRGDGPTHRRVALSISDENVVKAKEGKYWQ